LLDFFNEGEKKQARTQIAQVLKGVVSQRLLKRTDGKGFVCACEVMKVNQTIQNLIKEDKVHQVYTIIDALKNEGMVTMNEVFLDLYRKGIVDISEVIEQSPGRQDFVEQVFEETTGREDALACKGFLGLRRGMVLFEANLKSESLSNFGNSGILLDTPMGLLFRDNGRAKDNLNFITDYTIMSRGGKGFSLNSVFFLAYKILEAKEEKPLYDFKLTIITDNKEEIKLPQKQVGLLKSKDWNTLIVPIPKTDKGKEVRSYTLLFDSDIKDIVLHEVSFT